MIKFYAYSLGYSQKSIKILQSIDLNKAHNQLQNLNDIFTLKYMPGNLEDVFYIDKNIKHPVINVLSQYLKYILPILVHILIYDISIKMVSMNEYINISMDIIQSFQNICFTSGSIQYKNDSYHTSFEKIEYIQNKDNILIFLFDQEASEKLNLYMKEDKRYFVLTCLQFNKKNNLNKYNQNYSSICEISNKDNTIIRIIIDSAYKCTDLPIDCFFLEQNDDKENLQIINDQIEEDIQIEDENDQIENKDKNIEPDISKEQIKENQKEVQQDNNKEENIEDNNKEELKEVQEKKDITTDTDQENNSINEKQENQENNINNKDD